MRGNARHIRRAVGTGEAGEAGEAGGGTLVFVKLVNPISTGGRCMPCHDYDYDKKKDTKSVL